MISVLFEGILYIVIVSLMRLTQNFDGKCFVLVLSAQQRCIFITAQSEDSFTD